MNTPALDKARDDELTTGEVIDALRELSAMNGGGSRAGIEVQWIVYSFLARVVWNGTKCAAGWAPSIEDALCEERKEIERCIAESA